MRRRQLFSLSHPQFVAPSYVDHAGKLFTRPARDVPLMMWPDGSWCPSANTFIRGLFEKNLSRRNKGGTLRVHASNVSHLLRFCWRRRVELHEITDNDFFSLIGELIGEKRPTNLSQPARSASTVISIGRSCLQLLDSVAKQSGDETLIGPNGRVRAVQKQFEIKPVGRDQARKGKVVVYWDHPALPEASEEKKRSPISTANIELLRRVIGSNSTSAHQRMRRHVVLKLLEITGARRGEIADIRVQWVVHASNMDTPMLRLPTFKKKSGKHRYVPVSRADLAFIMQYVEFYRRAILRTHLRRTPDHGFLLVSGTTALPLQANSITQDVKLLAHAAGINERACPHMFRHRFLTKLFVALIEQYQFQTPDDFRKMLMDSESFKQKVAEWSGHASTESLDYYIDLAFDEVGDFKRLYDFVNVGIAVDAFLGTLEAESQALQLGEPPGVVVARLLNEVTALVRDIKEKARVPVPDKLE